MNQDTNSNQMNSIPPSLYNSEPIQKVADATFSLAVAIKSNNPQRAKAALTRLENLSREAEYLLNLDTALAQRS